MRVIGGCLTLAISFALINLTWAGQDQDKKKEKDQPKEKVHELTKVTVKELRIENELDENDEGYGTKMYAKFYHVKFVKGKTYTIHLMGKGTFNPYLFVEDAKKKVLAEDDDSGGGLGGRDAQIVFKAPEDAVYKVVATSSVGVGTGPFRLLIEEK